MAQKTVLICGAGSFTGEHFIKWLKNESFRVHGVDLKFEEHAEADDFVIGDFARVAS